MYQIRNWVYFTGSAPTIFTIYVKVSWIVINMRWQQGGIYKAAAVLIRHFKSIIRPTEYLYPVNTSHVCLFENKSKSPMSMSQCRGLAYPALISQPLKYWCNASIITRTKSMHITSELRVLSSYQISVIIGLRLTATCTLYLMNVTVFVTKIEWLFFHQLQPQPAVFWEF